MLNPVTLSIMKELQKKVEVLLHYSDSHFPYTVSAVGKDFNFLEMMQEEANNKPVVELSTEHFFSQLIKTHSWLTEEEKYRIDRYKDLKNFFKLRFTEVKVLKIGELYMDVYLAGKTQEGDFVILATNELHLPKHIAFDY